MCDIFITRRITFTSIMCFTFGAVTVLVLAWLQSSACDTPCPDGRLCPTNWTCCEVGCCVPTTAYSRSADVFKDHGFMSHAWYAQWPVLFLLGILGGILICCTWFCFCKRYSTSTADSVLAISCSCCMNHLITNDEIDSAGSLYPPPHYSRCGSFHQAPPPYSEVQSKPDLYPLVITCADGEGKAGGNYVMVQYFRNYIIRPPPGSLSATSTAESLNSSFICNASNEANSIIPPPYSCANNFEEYNTGRTMLRSMSSLTETRVSAVASRPRTNTASATATPSRQRSSSTAFRENLLISPVHSMEGSSYPDLTLELMDGETFCERRPRVGTSPTKQHPPSSTNNVIFEPGVYGLTHLCRSSAAGCTSPPQPTSPTQTSKTSLERPNDDRQKRRLEILRRNIRKSSLYMPLSAAHPVRPSRISPGARASSRSAPATPCSNLVPNLLNFTQRVSASRNSSRSSRLEEEYDSLLTEGEDMRTDHKF